MQDLALTWQRCLSVRVSVTLWYCIKTTKLASRLFHWRGGVAWEWCQKQCYIYPNRRQNYYIVYYVPVVPHCFFTDTETDDLEWPFCIKFCFWTACFGPACSAFQRKPLGNKQRYEHIIITQQICSPETLVFNMIRFMRLFTGIPWRRSVKQEYLASLLVMIGFYVIPFQL